ncbi:MAG: hypothetical protein ACLQVM_06745 [Terriglobia bacterium]
MIIPDRTKKRIRILVQFIPGSIIRSDGLPLPRVRDGTFADLVLPASAIADEGERLKLEAESLKELLPSGVCVLVGLSPGMMKEKPDGLVEADQLKTGYGYLFAEARLKEPLNLRRRGDKEAVLESCKCDIALLKAEARSLNHAFTLLSMKFETKRISHTGNVFARVYFFSDKSKEWRPLDELRGHIEHLLPSPT